MHPVERHLFKTNFKDLAGSHLRGTIALSDELINLGIMDFLQGLQAEAAGNSGVTNAPDATEGRPDPKALLALLAIEKLQFRSAEGRIFVDLAVELPG